MSRGAEPDRGAIEFAERLIALLDEGAYTATYKFAVLLALLDSCLEGTSAAGAPPDSVATADLARRVTELYWPQTNPYAGLSGTAILRQNSSGQAEIIRDIRRFRERNAPDPSTPLAEARAKAPLQFAHLLETVEWKLIEMPLPRLQVMGRVHDPFIYRIGWDAHVKRPQTRVAGFDARVHFVGKAAEYLVQLGGLLRPLIETKWANRILRFNRQMVSDAGLPEFLFGAERVSLGAVRPVLRELQGDRCFYCGGGLRSAAEVDHFVPWARWPDNGIENLVASHPGCNNSKRDFFAATRHLEAWLPRFDQTSGLGRNLRDTAGALDWDTHPARTLSVARAFYLHLPGTAKLWLSRDAFENADRPRIVALLAS
ncbi:MAG: HNH endonuclease signature motif containing protein [Actinobacteria bacterium]|nr:HNH endonuclease signature motif containing protein [Actinomycetota bacterium]